ncbi:MAG: hypothetical protein RQ826_06305 [Xanthomonadales bacterium]|nr:hypothetical protein [Xanthomonadales bacterium]
MREVILIEDQVMRFDRKKLGFDVVSFAQVKLTAHARSLTHVIQRMSRGLFSLSQERILERWNNPASRETST